MSMRSHLALAFTLDASSVCAQGVSCSHLDPVIVQSNTNCEGHSSAAVNSLTAPAGTNHGALVEGPQ